MVLGLVKSICSGAVGEMTPLEKFEGKVVWKELMERGSGSRTFFQSSGDLQMSCKSGG